MIKRDIIIYLTGFFDGEGHVSLLKKNHHKYIKKTKRKRPGRHAKSYSKRRPKRKKYRGQGK